MRRFPRPPGPRASALLALGLACVLAEGLAAQRGCGFVAPTANAQGVTIAGLGQVFYVSRPHIRCQDGVYISADSAVAYPSQSRTELMGNVRFSDAFRELRSDQARYFSQQARLQASGNLFVEDTIRGSQIENGALILLRQTEFREQEEMTVTQGVDGLRPRARLYLRPAPDTGAAGPEPRRTEPAAAPDSTVADSLVTLPDSTVADSLAAPPDSLLVPDSLATPDTAVVDTVALVADTAVAVADTAMAPDTPTLPDAIVAPDTVAVVPPAPDTVPYVVEADRLFLQGEELFLAHGNVEITRDSLHAYADSTSYDQMAGLILLQGSARVDGSGYDLTGRDIDLGVPDGSIRTLRATRDGLLTGDRLRLRSPIIELYLTDGAMDRLIATPMQPLPGATEPLEESERARPVAEAEEFTLTADSIEVVAPGEALDRITAVGSARGVSSSRDSLNVEGLPEIARHDWLEGDTVVASFVQLDSTSVPGPADSAGGRRYQLDRLVASGTARSLYRLDPSDSASVAGSDPPAVHYVTGSLIVIVLAGGEVQRMEVEGGTRGWHLEPLSRGAPQDTAVTDTSAVRPDTTAARPDTSLAPHAHLAPSPAPAGIPGERPHEPGPMPTAAPAPTSRHSRRHGRR